jgi:hypothetical protein
VSKIIYTQSKVPSIKNLLASNVDLPGYGMKVFILASGVVDSSGWSSIRLSPYFYSKPPEDGMWELDFLADKPSGPVLETELPVTTFEIFSAPNWMEGIRVYGESDHIDLPVSKFKKMVVKDTPDPCTKQVPSSNVIIRKKIASYEDSWQPIGMCSLWSVKMKKLVHDLWLTVEGPSESEINACFQKAVAIGLIVAIVAAYATGGAALHVAVSAFLSYLKGCLGNKYSAHVDDKSHWVEWCT